MKPEKELDRILIADDDNIDRKLLETYLQHSGYELITTKNGEEAWQTISSSKNPPQIAIIDWLMPEMDGITLCKKIRQLEFSHYIYIILVTGKSMSADIVQGLDAGADDYVTKPYEKSVLLARINVGARILRLEQEKNEQLKKIQSTNQKLQQNMEAAAEIQFSLLPPRDYIIGKYRFDWYFNPSELLGGDMLHVYKLSETKVACWVLDVSGHGTQAALLSVTIRNQLTVNSADATAGHNYGRLISLESQSNIPLDVIRELSNHYGDLLEKTGHYFTITFGILDITTGKFDYVSAGHFNPFLISRDSKNKVITSDESGGAPIGMFRNLEYIQQQIQLEPNDRLYLFSDGVVEESDSKGDQFGTSRLIEELKRHWDAPDRFEKVIGALKVFSQKESFKDDIALVEISCINNKC